MFPHVASLLLYVGEPEGAGTIVYAGGYRYQEVDASAQVYDIITAGGVKYVVVAEGAVTPEQFGARGDGSDETAILEKVAAWGRRNGGLHLRLTPGKTYGYTNNKFLCNIPNFLIVDGNGAALQNRFVSEGGTSGYTMDKECLVFGTAWDEAGAQNLNGVWVPYSEGALLAANVNTGDTTFEVAAGEGVNFTAGERALLYGFFAQQTSFPSTCRFFEYVTIAEVSGDTITTEGPIGNDYRTDWLSNGATPSWGPAKAISLSRTTFQETARMVFNSVHFKADPAWVDALRSGRVWIGNYGRAELNGCVGDAGLYVMQGQHFTDTGSTFLASVEIDKFIETVTLNGVDYASISQGTGAKRIVHNDTTIRQVVNVAAGESLTFNGGTLKASAGTGAALPCTWGCNTVRFDGTRLITDAANTALLGYTQFAATFTEGGFDPATRLTRLTIPEQDWVASGIFRAIRPGSILTDLRGTPVLRVRIMPWNAGSGTIALEGERLDGGLTSPLALYLNGTTDIDMAGLRQTGPAPVAEPVTAGLYSAWAGRIASSRPREHEVVVTSNDLAEPGTTPAAFQLGYPVQVQQITFDVSKAYGGGSLSALLKFDDVDFAAAGLVNIATFDLKQTGRRTIDLSGASGSVGSDAFSALPANALPKVVLRTAAAVDYASASERPVWSLTLSGYRMA